MMDPIPSGLIQISPDLPGTWKGLQLRCSGNLQRTSEPTKKIGPRSRSKVRTTATLMILYPRQSAVEAIAEGAEMICYEFLQGEPLNMPHDSMTRVASNANEVLSKRVDMWNSIRAGCKPERLICFFVFSPRVPLQSDVSMQAALHCFRDWSPLTTVK